MPISRNQINAISRGFLKYLQKTGQLSLLPELARQHLRAAKTQTDPHTAQILTVVPLSAHQTKQLETILGNLFHHPITVHNQTQPNILGGLFIRIGDKVIDISLKNKLDTLYETLNHHSYA